MNFIFFIFFYIVTGFTTYSSSLNNDEVADPFKTYIFMAIECPISQKYVYRLNELNKLYPDMNIVGVFQENTSEAELSDFKQRFGIDFPIVLDKNHRWALQFKAEITPEVFLVDRFDRVLYSGAIDNWFISLGRNRKIPSEHYLLDAFSAIRHGVEVKKKRTKAVGCFLELSTKHHHGQ
jgi:hypothetical protein